MRSPFALTAVLLSALLASEEPAPAQIREVPPPNGNVVLNEIFYAPADPRSREEFVELHNRGAEAADISGWSFSAGISWTAPPGTTIPPGGYLVVAQDPSVLRTLYGVEAKGPFVGRLENDGERLALRNASGALEDEVDYGLGFPWPTTGRPANLSIELIHPGLDNDLGGSWRSSSPSLDGSRTLIPSGAVCRYFEGTAEPPAGWKAASFDDAGWRSGAAPVGYGEPFIATELAGMRGGYSSVYFRKAFDVGDPSAYRSLVLEVRYDDGFNAWLNGVHVAAANVPSEAPPHDAVAPSAVENANFEEFALPRPADCLARGRNVLAVHLLNSSLADSSDAFFDARLLADAGSDGPTPGRRNSVYSESVPPQVRQVQHEPRAPVSRLPVLVAVKATDPDGVARVALEYQVVEPGAYIRLTDPEYAANWTELEMRDDGLAGDEVAGDSTYSVLIPASVQEHRRLVRYRIAATDGTGAAVKVPYRDDPQPNFAYFVYDFPPAWEGSARPGVAPVVAYSTELLSSLPIYHFVTRRSDRLDALHVPYRWGSPDAELPKAGEYWGEEYPWLGTLVYEGEVYDHVSYRARGGVWRYSMGKNMWKFDFSRGHYFRARDDHGRPYKTRWDKLNFSAIIQQGDYRQRGEQGLFESVGFRLHNLAGNPTSHTHFVHFRLVESEDEFGPDQFSGDFQGLYLVLEQLDGRFLEEHGLPDGNLYKMEGGTGELNNDGPDQPADKSDLVAFLSGYESARAEAWFHGNLNLDDYYNYRAILLAIHDYDDHAGKNYFYFNDPETLLWRVFNWDLDLTWTTTYGGGGGEDPLNRYVLDPFPAFQVEFRNRVRELRDLLFNPDQTGALIDEAAGVVFAPGGPSFVDADRAMWDYNPILVSSYVRPEKAGHGRFYQASPTRDFAGMVKIMKDYVASRGQWLDSTVAADSAIPARPTVTSTSPPGFPIDRLTFRSSAFSDPQGAGTFGGMKWRIGEVTPKTVPGFVRGSPRRYEIEPVWESGTIAPFAPEIQIPPGAVRPGSTYRVRVRMGDTTGRWSRWSEPVEFVAGEPTSPFPEQTSLRVTEVMYHPPYDADIEFVELENIGSAPLDLRPVAFVEGIEFRFAEGSVRDLGPGEFVVVVADRRAFSAYYDASEILVAGEYRGRLANGGERLRLVYGAGLEILDFAYADSWYPGTDGLGRSLAIVDPAGPTEDWGRPEGWKESADFGGSPGRADGDAPPGGLQRPGDANQDGVLDISDALSILFLLYGGGGVRAPCEGDLGAGGAAALLDLDGNARAEVTDAIYALRYLFASGPSPALGERCVRIPGCPSACRK